ncbi:glycosyltransferase [Formosa undariae]|uniref:Glycosyltransferase n=1 Tax=Formosa undariae TaxID=1325436 RepID=A0ABV5EW95_9FLAO
MSYRSIVIVIATYNRPESLNRLLKSIENANYPKSYKIDLIVSCDYSGVFDCENVANDFSWKFGEKKVIAHKNNLGLRKHILYCGDLVKDYDGIIMLEDDLWVAPNFFKFIIEADQFYKGDERIGQISLYTNQIDEYSNSRFVPLDQAADVFFMQVPSSWGQYWTKEQWLAFKDCYERGDLKIDKNSLLPEDVLHIWPESSWKKYFYNYLVKKDLFVVYPNKALSTNFGEAGTHYFQKHLHNQAVLDNSNGKYKFVTLEASNSVYDYNLEYHKDNSNYVLSQSLQGYDVEFDLNGTKNLNKINSEYLISSKTCLKPIKQFGYDLIPKELNITYNLEGDFYTLAKTSDFSSEIPKDKIMKRNIQFVPQAITTEIGSLLKSRYENSNSFKLGNKIISFFRFFSFKK